MKRVSTDTVLSVEQLREEIERVRYHVSLFSLFSYLGEGFLMRSLAIVLLLASVVIAKPDRSIPPPVGKAKKEEEKIAKIDYMSNWGKIDQHGRKLTITG